MMKFLIELRAKIDATDEKIYQLIKQRANLADKIGKIKSDNNDNIFYKPEREAQILQKIIDKNSSLLRDKDIAYIFRQIMSACLALEQPMNISYLGPEGTWTGEAAIKHFGGGVNTFACFSIDEVFSQIENNNADYGIAPIENSSNGTITATINLLYHHNLKICGEVEVRIKHQLLAKSGFKKTKNINKIIAHQQALDQCRKYLKNNYPNIEQQAVASNAIAAKMASNNANILAIASRSASDIYKLDIVAKNIEDSNNNTTRFLVIGKSSVGISGKDKTTILITAKHKSGMLYDILMPFKKNDINLLKLDSYPDPNHNKWQYLFLIDFVGHVEDIKIKNILNDLESLNIKIKILGSYPIASI